MRKDHHINLSFKRRGSRRRRKRKRRGRRRYKRSGLVFKFVTRDKNGKKRNHYVKASSLGRVQDSESTFTNPSDYTLAGIDKKLDENKERAKQARANQRKAEKEAHDKHVQAVRQRQLQRQRQHEQQLEIIKIERKKKNDKRKLLQRQRSQRINQVKSSVKESVIQCNQYDNVTAKPQPEPSKSAQQLPDELRKATKQTWRTGTLGRAFATVRHDFNQVIKHVRSGLSRAYNFITRKRKKQRQESEKRHQKLIHDSYRTQYWFGNHQDGEHLELYLSRVFAMKYGGKMWIDVVPRYRRDISRYNGGNFVYSKYHKSLNKDIHNVAMPLDSLNEILRYNHQLPLSKALLSNRIDRNKNHVFRIIDGNYTYRKPVAFRSTVFPLQSGGHQFAFNRIEPSHVPFSYQHEVKLAKAERQREQNTPNTPSDDGPGF